MPPQTPVGLIGVGLTGEVYARRLIAAGFGVIGIDVDPARNEQLKQIGGRIGALVDIARQCDPIVLAVFSTDQVEEVVERALVPAQAGITTNVPECHLLAQGGRAKADGQCPLIRMK
jgi:3-hydroxyisobutyrate dehydrogenase-like beta-hydroxyacid dehydrogenase